jgi:hypothetical protein
MQRRRQAYEQERRARPRKKGLMDGAKPRRTCHGSPHTLLALIFKRQISNFELSSPEREPTLQSGADDRVGIASS